MAVLESTDHGRCRYRLGALVGLPVRIGDVEVGRIADVLMEKKEIFGDDLLDLLDSVGLRIPELDYGDEAVWPPPFFAITSRERRPKEIEAK